MNENKSVLMSNAAVQQLRSVPGFDPMKLLRKTISVKTGLPVWKLDLRYKRLWFRLACPNGKMLLKPLRISDQMAIIEAQVYFNKDDSAPAASFTSEQRKENVPGGEFLRAAQDDALNMALENAGFGIQFCDVCRDCGGELFGSEVPAQAESTAESEEQEHSVQQAAAEEVMPETAETTPAEQGEEQSIAPAAEETQPETPSAHVVQFRQPEEIIEEVAQQNTASYSADMDVDEIVQRMTVDEAMRIEVSIGTCRGWTLEQVAQRRPASLKWYLYGCDQADNVLKAAASILLDNLQQKAG